MRSPRSRRSAASALRPRRGRSSRRWSMWPPGRRRRGSAAGEGHALPQRSCAVAAGVQRRPLPAAAAWGRIARRYGFGVIAFVTGGGRGIGANIARKLREDGWEVVVAARTPEQVETVAQEIGGRAVALDVTDRDAVERAVAENGPGRSARRQRGCRPPRRRDLGGRAAGLVAHLRDQRPGRAPLLPRGDP